MPSDTYNLTKDTKKDNAEMDAKEAILNEIGDLFAEQPEKVAEDAAEEVEELEEEVGGPPSLFDLVYSEREEDVEDSPKEDQEEEAKGGNAEESEATSDNVDLSQMTDEELQANVDAVIETMTTTRMPKESFDWGMGYLDRLYKEQERRVKDIVDSVDIEADKALWAEEEAAEEAQEKSTMERIIG